MPKWLPAKRLSLGRQTTTCVGPRLITESHRVRGQRIVLAGRDGRITAEEGSHLSLDPVLVRARAEMRQ